VTRLHGREKDIGSDVDTETRGSEEPRVLELATHQPTPNPCVRLDTGPLVVGHRAKDRWLFDSRTINERLKV